MAAADVLDERVPGGDNLYAAELFEPAHRSQSGFQPSVIGFDRVVSVLLGDMTGGRRQLIEHPRVGGRAISGDLDRGRPVIKGTGEESASGGQIPLLGDHDVNDLADWSIARYRYTHRPLTLTYVSSTNQRSPGACRQGRAASISSGVNRCTQRYTVTWVKHCSCTMR